MCIPSDHNSSFNNFYFKMSSADLISTVVVGVTIFRSEYFICIFVLYKLQK